MMRKKKTVKKRKKAKKTKVKKRVKKRTVKKKKQKTRKKLPKAKKITKKKAAKKEKKVKIEVVKRFLKKPREKKEKVVHEISKEVLVEDLMLRNPIFIDIKSTIHDAIEVLDKYNLKSIIVVDNRKPVGMVDEGAILSFLSKKVKIEEIDDKTKELTKLLKLPVKEVMQEIPFLAKKTTSLSEVVKIFDTKDVNQIPVVDREGKIIGTILEENVLDYLKYTTTDRTLEKKVVKTGIDKLLDLINKKNVVTSKEAAEKLKMSISEVEKFARILQSHGLIDIDFSTIGVVKLIKKEREEF